MFSEEDMAKERRVAYFSMEIALDSDIPTYSGGLGILAGDILRSAADLEVPVIGVTLVYNNGYFYQMLDFEGVQRECNIQWDYSTELEKTDRVIKLDINGRTVNVGVWRFDLVGHTGHVVPVYLLDTNVEGNDDEQRSYTRLLYDATPYQRIIQERILGVGGVKMLRELGYDDLRVFHMNEGHSAFLSLELLRESGGDEKKVRRSCVFTTHTPVWAGHDVFDFPMVKQIFGAEFPEEVCPGVVEDGRLNMTRLALKFSGYVNAVSRKHGKVTREMFPQEDIDHITNGIHVLTWLHPKLRELYKKYLQNINHDPSVLAAANNISSTALALAHERIKMELLDYEKSHSWVLLEKNVLTIGFARRITGYKRPTLFLHDIDRLGRICQDRAQIVMAGKTHPMDHQGKELIKHIFWASKYLWEKYRVVLVFLNNYDIDLAQLLVSGVDLWLNTPRRYMEASGTSGMKAAINAVPNLSILDGWWIEGYERSRGAAGWAIGPGPEEAGAIHRSDEEDANDIYDKLENIIIPMYYDDRNAWIDMMKRSITLGAHFNTDRVVMEYAKKAWRLRPYKRWVSESNDQ